MDALFGDLPASLGSAASNPTGKLILLYIDPNHSNELLNVPTQNSRLEESSCAPVPDELETSFGSCSFTTEIEIQEVSVGSNDTFAREHLANTFNALNNAVKDIYLNESCLKSSSSVSSLARDEITYQNSKSITRSNDASNTYLYLEYKRPPLVPIVTSNFHNLQEKQSESDRDSILEFSSQEIINFGNLFGKMTSITS